MRTIYSIAWWIAMPLVLLRLWWRGRKEPGYRAHVGERFGFYPADGHAQQALLWIHAVSVGETRAAEPLIRELLATYPGHAILLTHMTPTGRAAGQALFADLGSRVVQSYLPYDTGWMSGRFLDHFRPRICILMETEVWPNLIAQCVRHRVPVAMVNARLSERSLNKAQRLTGLMQEAAQGFALIAAQTDADAIRLREMGAVNVHVTGSIKFDVTPPIALVKKGEALRQRIGARPVLLCASTREGEEELILDAFLAAAPALQDLLLLIVPRHPQRFDSVARMIEGRGLVMRRRSGLGDFAVPGESVGAPDTKPVIPADVEVLLGDSMGEMFAYYSACDIAFIGGSLLPLGGQNLIEACSLGKPVLVGPHTFNFMDVTEDAVQAGAAVRVAHAGAMLAAARKIRDDNGLRKAMSESARTFATRSRGATALTVSLLQQLVK